MLHFFPQWQFFWSNYTGLHQFSVDLESRPQKVDPNNWPQVEFVHKKWLWKLIC